MYDAYWFPFYMEQASFNKYDSYISVIQYA